MYQTDGDLNDVQVGAFDVRRVVEKEIGRPAFNDLDRLLSLPDGVVPRLAEAGREYVGRLLTIVSVILDIQAGGTEFGAEQEEWERKPDPVADLRNEQPWLFEPAKRQAGQKLSTNKVRGRLVA